MYYHGLRQVKPKVYRRRKNEERREKIIDKPSQKKRTRSGKYSEAGRWMDERRRQRAGTPILDLLRVLIEWGKKAGKQVIRSTGLSIEVGVGGT